MDRKKLFLSLTLIYLTSFFSYGQKLGLELIDSVKANYPYDSTFKKTYYNDVWGWTDDDGTEYGILGTLDGAEIYKIADTLEHIQTINKGSKSTWGDFKTYKNYLYGTDESVAAPGIWIKNMHELDDSTFVDFTPTLEWDTVTAVMSYAHNLYIDEKGFLYVAGARIRRGIFIFDLKPDPLAPTYAGYVPTSYCHDVIVQDDLMATSNYYSGSLNLFDVSDKENPVFLGSTQTKGGGTHNAWFSDDNKYIFTTDEVRSGAVESYDISDPENIKFLDQFRHEFAPSPFTIPHNAHYKDGFLITSYYTEGLVVLDVSQPDNMVMVARYDTYPENNFGFHGNWGAFPYFDSGIILASDMQRGLYAFKPTYKSAAFISGNVADGKSKERIDSVSITFVGDTVNSALTNPEGIYRTGTYLTDSVTIIATAPDYPEYRKTLFLSPGESIELNIELGNYTAVSNQLDASQYAIERTATSVEISTEDYSSAQIIDFTGRILETSNGEKTHSLATQNLSTGNYVIRIKTDRGEISKTIFIQ